MIAAMWFAEVTLEAGESRSYQVALSIGDDPTAYLRPEAVAEAFARTKAWWQSAARMSIATGDKTFNSWTAWVGIQPILRRICGCSFMPHHDYGRGGRGWRDLWQDSLALLLTDSAGVRSDLCGYFRGVRIDGTNATIIGSKPGEFKADRNGIPRVWMDHGFWPVLTVDLYLDETGDDTLLLEREPYFSDTLPWRGEAQAPHDIGVEQCGTVLEHMLVQATAAFCDVGEHGHCRLRGADWNDGLDMAGERGESVAFTAAYAYAFDCLSAAVARLEASSVAHVELLAPLWELLSGLRPDSPEHLRGALMSYCEAAGRQVARQLVPCAAVIERLDAMAEHIRSHIRASEWVGDGVDQHWFNSYYDNDGQPLDGLRGNAVNMMLTGQVFCLMAGIADDQQKKQIVRAADWYLCYPNRGGYCLNTDFDELKLNMGRMFGFAYGHKENGAVFSHMAVMYAYALYARGMAAEGWRVLEMLYRQSTRFDMSGILPGIPEYFDDRGRGMYPYLTGAASWLMLTLRTQAFGVRGQAGDLRLEPKLTAAQFDSEGIARISCRFADRAITVYYHNPMALEWSEYLLGEVAAGGKSFIAQESFCLIPRRDIASGMEIHATLAPIE